MQKIKAPLRLKFVCVCCVGEVLYKGNYSHLKQIKKHISSPLAPNHEVSFAHYPNELDAPPLLILIIGLSNKNAYIDFSFCPNLINKSRFT
jgi:hypothetical protein